MLKGTLVVSTPSHPQGRNSWQRRFDGLLNDLDALSPPRIQVDLHGDDMVVRELRQTAPLARLRLDASGGARIVEGQEALAALTDREAVPVALHLGGDRLLQRAFRLPRTTPPSDLRGAIGFEIERHTPFRAQDVTYGWHLEDVPGDTRLMTAHVAMAQRRPLQQIISNLRAHNLIAVRLTVEAAGNEIILEVPDDAVAPRRRRRRWRQAVLLLGLAAALISPPLWLQHRAGQITSEAHGLRDQLRTGAATGTPTVEGKLFDAVANLRRHPETIETLNQLSAILPDGTWLTTLSINGGDVVIEGISDDNVRLVQLLEASPGFTAVTYAAPVVRNQQDDNERFVFNLTRVSR